jgi:non-heme chloroperoxidase
LPILTVKDGSEIFYKDWGAGPVIVFAHGWPLSADMWDNQMLHFGLNGFRVVAFDRRGFGRSSQNWTGNTNEQFADDLAELFEKLDLTGVTLVAHSMAGGEAARYVGRHSTARLAKLVLLSAVTPGILQRDDNPHGVPIQGLDGIRDGVRGDRATFFAELAKTFFGFNRLLSKDIPAMREHFWAQAMRSGVKAAYDCVDQFSQDFSADVAKIDKPTLIIHGDSDEIVPFRATAERAAALIPHATLKTYTGGSHAISYVDADEFNRDLLAFLTTP